MTHNDFNSRINLQAFCDANGVTGYSFVKIPRFGWFATDKATGEIRTLIDFLPADGMVQFCTDLILEKPQYHDCRIMYNEVSVTRLVNDIRIWLTMKKFHADAIQEFKEGQAYSSGQKVNLSKMFEANGMKHFVDTGVGYVSEALHKAYKTPLDLPSNSKGKLVIPTWCSPQHVASFEICDIAKPNHRTTFYTNGEKGWYGKPEKTVYGNFSNLMTHPGCTWDKKLTYWALKPLDLDESLDVNQCLQVWTEAEDMAFKRDPLDVIEAINGSGKLKFNVDQLTLSQTLQLEKRFNVKLADFWRAQKYSQVAVGNLTFVAKDMRYYVKTKFGELQEFTNFNIEINRIYKKDGKFFRQGVVYHEGKQEPFELLNEDFLNTATFVRKLNYFFLNRALGVPLISNSFQGYLLEVVNRLNINCMIDPVG